jgi:glutamate-ammonia-ligase adenylyltransferase
LEAVYASKNINPEELRLLREKQFAEKTGGGRRNAKFSPGGLVDLEYAIQVLQITYGENDSALRTPRTHDALVALSHLGVLSGEEALQLDAAYDFFRKLINAMRMVRGSAKDLFLPNENSEEFTHLARRMGYARGDALAPSQRLHIDLETFMAAIRAFVDRHFGRDSLPGPATGTVADLVLSEDLPRELCQRVLSRAGFDDPSRALVNLQSLSGDRPRRQVFARLGLLAFDVLSRTPDPDMALNNWERYIRTLPSVEFHYNTLLSQPMRLEILLKIFASSQFLADTLVRHPGFLDWLIIPQNLQQICKRQDLERELRMASSSCETAGEWLNKIRRFRRRELLRIGTRDMCLAVGTEEIMLELSILAETITQVALDRILTTLQGNEESVSNEGEDPNKDFCVMAFGKLGGSELNYSSDIDLMGLQGLPEVSQKHGRFNPSKKDACVGIMERIRADLSTHTQEGYAYRVDLRLRPYGSQGCLVPSLPALIDYYKNTASLWEIQAALKMRPIAGNLQIGYQFLEQIHPLLMQNRKREDVVGSIEKMRKAAIKKSLPGRGKGVDVKAGIGGLRDVEFLVQGLQLIHGPKNRHVLTGNTLIALDRLRDAEILPEPLVAQLRSDYLFLRRVEHHLQILEDRQVHALPRASKGLAALAKRVLGVDTTAHKFIDALDGAFGRIREAYTTYLLEGKH